MNKKKENFGSVSIVERLISNDNTRAAIRTDLKDWCNSKNSYEICQNAIHSGRYYKNKKKKCSSCFNNCSDKYGSSGTGNPSQQNWCKIGCNRKFNSNNVDGVCPQKIDDL